MKDFDIWNIEFMAARFQPLPTGNRFLDNRYEWQRIANKLEWPYYRFFRELTKDLRPSLVVELGGWQGTAAAHLAAGHKSATVVTIDHHSDPGDEYHLQKMIEACQFNYRIKYLRGWTNGEIAHRERGNHHLGDQPNVYPDVLRLVQNIGKIDILFIDSWHTYENAKLDWEYYGKLMNSPGLVICDDIEEGEIEAAPISGMMRFWKELPEPKFLNKTLHPGTKMGFLKV